MDQLCHILSIVALLAAIAVGFRKVIQTGTPNTGKAVLLNDAARAVQWTPAMRGLILMLCYLCLDLLTETVVAFMLTPRLPNHFVYAIYLPVNLGILLLFYHALMPHKTLILFGVPAVLLELFIYIKGGYWRRDTVIPFTEITGHHVLAIIVSLIALWNGLKHRYHATDLHPIRFCAIFLSFYVLGMIDFSLSFSADISDRDGRTIQVVGFLLNTAFYTACGAAMLMVSSKRITA